MHFLIATVTHATGCTDGPACTTLSTAAAVAAAKASEVSILIVGLKYGMRKRTGSFEPFI